MTSTPSNDAKLPVEVFDAHHHFLDTRTNDFQSFLGALVPNDFYLPEDYHRDVVAPLAAAGIKVVGSAHIECLPDDGLPEAQWLDSLNQAKDSVSTVDAIVASADLSLPTVEAELKALVKIPKVKGIRWILDCVGKFDGNSATHIATKRHDGVDFLRGSEGGYQGSVVPAFAKGFGLLSKYNLSFDLQCAPVQLEAAAALLAQHPDVPCVIDHLGKPRMLLGTDTPENASVTTPNETELANWRKGMKAMASVPNAHVKLSMLGYAIPGWTKTQARKDLMKSLVVETIQLFGPQRCMVATNYYKSDAISDADGLSDVGPTPLEFITFLSDCLSSYSEADRRAIFSETAQKFYKIDN